MKRKPTVTVEYLGWEGTGRNKTDAKKDAMAKIERAAGSYRPVVFNFRGNMAVAFRCPDGWYLEFLYGEKLEQPMLLVWGHGAYETQADVGKSARMWLAQQGWDGQETTAPILTDDQQGEFAKWVGFQKAYKHAAAQGMNDHEAHSFACHHDYGFINA
jgi:hypothetical protein